MARSGSPLTLPPYRIIRMHGRCRARHTGGTSCSFTPLFRGVVSAATANLTYLLQTKTGTLLGRQGSDFLEDSAGSDRNALKLWWVQQDSNLRPAD